MAAQFTTLLISLGFLASIVSAGKYLIISDYNTETLRESLPVTPTDHTLVDDDDDLGRFSGSGMFLDNHASLDIDCLTLTQYASSISTVSIIDSNITLIFEPGHHTLDSRLQLQNVNKLVLQVAPTNSSLFSVATITCTNSTGFDFATISKVSISGLDFSGCKENTVRSVDQLRMEFCRFQGGHGVKLNNVRNATIKRSYFVSLTAFQEAWDQWLEEYVLSGGAIVAFSSNITVTECLFDGNSAVDDHYGNGGAIWSDSGSISIHGSNFSSNTVVGDGGAVWTYSGHISIHGSKFSSNRAGDNGGAISTVNGIDVHDSIFNGNIVGDEGGAIWIYGSNISINGTVFNSNTAGDDGGAIRLVTRTFNMRIFVHVHDSNFSRNTAGDDGGAIANSGSFNIHGSNFDSNTAGDDGGAMHTYSGSISIHGSVLSGNTADRDGGVIWTRRGNTTIQDCDFSSNAARTDGGAIGTVRGSISIHRSKLSNNTASLGGVLKTESGSITINDSVFIRNTAHVRGGVLLLGSATNSVNEINNCIFNCSYVVHQGGAIYVQSRTLSLKGLIKITNNTAMSGGGIYAYQSELNFDGMNFVSKNIATSETTVTMGGGIYASGSSIKLTGGQLEFIENKAEKGGGIYLESDAKLHLIKSVPECFSIHYNPRCIKQSMSSLRLYFTNNSAEYGGALYISDDKDVCATTFESTECFLQDIALYDVSYPDLIVRNTFFANNSASISGASIFGGLFDRCEVNPSAQVFNKYQNTYISATLYLTQITNLRTNAILDSETSSKPVRVCLCTNNKPDCDKPPITPTFKKTSQVSFSISVVAVDQLRSPIASSVRALSSNRGGLAIGQDIQNTTSNCTDLSYTISIPRDSEQLVLNLEDQEFDFGIAMSQIIINMLFNPCTCPIGFIVDQSTCDCKCDPCLFNYITECSISNSSVKRSNNVWIIYTNVSNETQCHYLTYPHCPFDYCHPSSSPVWINLNTLNGSDAQCAFNRSGKLCGSCKNGLSISLGGSHCLSCSNNWLTLLLVFAIAGVALVAFLLIFNFTVAVGTINGLVFYANIVTINSATFFPFESPNFFTIFIAWLNLDFGFVTCFFDGMDGYIKEWLQLAFPMYIILLVVMVIIGCEYSTRFARLFTGTNPVATLATLILLSYAKSIRVIIAAFSSATLKYPDGSSERVWLIDANIHFLNGRHLPLFLVAVLILLVGIVYTFTLFSYQWLLRCPKLRLIKNPRFFPFMDAYLAPFNTKHRYWTGSMLFTRAFLYIVASINVSGDPGNNLLSIICIVFFLLLVKILLPRRIYKSWSLDALETSFIFNLGFFCISSLYIRSQEFGVGSQESLAYTSTSIVFISFLAILTYHLYAFVLKQKTRTKLNTYIHKIKLQITKQEPIDPEPILVPNCAHLVTYSVVDPMPSQQQLLENMEKMTTAAIAEREREATTSVENGNTKPSLVSMVPEQPSDEEGTTMYKEKWNTEIELQTSSLKYSDAYPDAYNRSRDSDKLGMDRETEIDDFIKVVD